MRETKSRPIHTCLACGHSPTGNGSLINCVHRGLWHSTFTSCTPRCGWGLGVSNLGKCHYSCCFSTDQNETVCSKNQSHSYSVDPTPNIILAQKHLFGVTDCPRYVVDLDAPPKTRWNHIVKAYTEYFPSVVSIVEDILGSSYAASIASTILSSAAKTGFVYYGDELRGIAHATNVPLGRVVMLQIAYEAFAACTSIVIDGPHGYPLHIRTMDWDMPELKPLTIEVDFIQNGVILYSATTWAGYVGVLTGVRPGGYSVSVNYRRTELGAQNGISGILTNLKRGVVGHWPVSFLVREVLSSEQTFNIAVGNLCASELMAPVYLTICGTQPGEGLVLSRDREGKNTAECVCERLDEKCDSVVQTNMDIYKCDRNDVKDDWQDICDSRYRRSFAKAALASVESLSMNDLWLLFSCYPCLACDTVYTT